MKIKIFIIVFLFNYSVLDLFSQHIIGSNLVINPSFEDYSYCPNYYSQINYAMFWTDARGGVGSSDYYNSCTTTPFVCFKENYQFPYNGNGMAGVALYMNPNNYYNYREYIQGKLINKLINKKKYCVSYYCLFAPTNGIAIDKIDAYISIDSLNSFNQLIPGKWILDSIPQILNKNGIITDSINWKKIASLYESNGNEQFITIGNFSDDSYTN